MNISYLANRAGAYLVELGNESSQIMKTITYERWLILSAMAVIVGFFLLRSDR